MATVAYAKVKDFTAHFGDDEALQLTDLANQGQADNTLLLLSLQDAADEINSYLSRAYKLPLPVSAIVAPLIRVSCDVARYRLYKDRPTEEVTTRYKLAMSWLKDVAQGTAVIVFDPPLDETQKDLTQIPQTVSSGYQGGVFGSAFDMMPSMEEVKWVV
jgi:phage gp36-like protein